MKKSLALIFLVLFFASTVFSENYSYDDSGKVVVDPNYSAQLISSVLTGNALSSLDSSSSQTALSYSYFWDSSTEKTVLVGLRKGSAYRIIRNSAYRIIRNPEEFSSYWIKVNDISEDEVEVSIGILPLLANKTENASIYSFLEFDCDEDLMADNAMEIPVKGKKTCSSAELGGGTITVEVTSVSTAFNGVASLEVEFIEGTEGKRMAETGKEEFLTNKSEAGFFIDKKIKLEGYPFYRVPGYGDPLVIPNPEAFDKPDRVFFRISGSMLSAYIDAEQKPFVNTALPASKETVVLRVLLSSELWSLVSEGKIQAKLFDSQGKEFSLDLISVAGKYLTQKVPKNTYFLKIIPVSPLYKEWTSGEFKVSSNPSDIMILKGTADAIKKDSVEVTVKMSDSVVNALDSVGVVPEVTDSSGQEMAVNLTFEKKLGSNYLVIPTPFGTPITISLPETTATKSYKEKIDAFNVQPYTTITIPDTIIKQGAVIEPTETFQVSFLVNEKQFELLEKNGLSSVRFRLFEKQGDNYIISDKEFYSKVYFEEKVTDSFFANLPRGAEYNLIIKGSLNSMYYNYYSKTGKTIVVPDSVVPLPIVVDLTKEFFGESDSLLVDNPVLEGKKAEMQAAASTTGKFSNLQVKSVNGQTCNKVCGTNPEENIPYHIVYLDKGVSQVLISLENFETGKPVFFSIGEKGKTVQAKIVDLNSTLEYPIKSGALEFDFSQVKSGLKFSVLSYSGQEIKITGWDGTPIEFYACQDKTGNGKCDLTGYNSDGTEKFGATYVEPNYEAASIEVQEAKEVAQGKAEVSMVIEYNLDIKCNIPEPVGEEPDYCPELVDAAGPKALEKAKQIIEETTSGETTFIGPDKIVIVINKSTGTINIGNITIEGDTYVFNFAPDNAVDLSREKQEIKLTVTVQDKGEKILVYERFGEQNQDCVIAMQSAYKFDKEIESNAELFSVNPNLLRAMIYSESSFNKDLKHEDGADYSYGLMQLYGLNESTWKDILGSDWKTTESWKNPELNIKAGTRFFVKVVKEVEGLNCNNFSKILTATGIAQATWKDALSVAAYNSGLGGVSCTEIKANSTRKTHVPRVLAWYRTFEENYGKEVELGSDYCKPTFATETPVISVPEACKTCNTIMECLACMDYKFVSGVFTSS
ncbi:MAG: transglycosylase SLT domain-containing protein [archaeon]